MLVLYIFSSFMFIFIIKGKAQKNHNPIINRFLMIFVTNYLEELLYFQPYCPWHNIHQTQNSISISLPCSYIQFYFFILQYNTCSLEGWNVAILEYIIPEVEISNSYSLYHSFIHLLIMASCLYFTIWCKLQKSKSNYEAEEKVIFKNISKPHNGKVRKRFQTTR